MADVVSTTISIFALVVSSTTAWLTFFRRGTIGITQPTQIYLGPDTLESGEAGPPKVFLRTLIFSTSKRGRMVENMYVTLSRNESKQNFSVWVYGEQKLVRGSGIFVGEVGFSAGHHFLTPEDGVNFRFAAGRYELRLVAKLLGDEHSKVLLVQELEISPENAAALTSRSTGLYFDWGPDSKRYIPRLHNRPTPANQIDPFAGIMVDMPRGTPGHP